MVRISTSRWVGASPRRVAASLVLIALLAAPATWLAIRLSELPGLPFIALIVAATLVGGLIGGAAAIVVSVPLLAYYTLPPIHTFDLSRQATFESLVAFTALMLVVAWVVRGRERARRQAQDQRREAGSSSDKLQMALDAAGLGTWEWDLSTGIVTWDLGLMAIYGVSDDTFDGSLASYQALIHPEDREFAERAVREAVESKTGHLTQHRIVRPDGEIRWVEGFGRVILDEAGGVTGMVGVSWDISERRAAERRAEQIQAVTDAALSALEPGEMISAVLDRIREVMLADAASLLMLDEGGTNLLEIDVSGRDHIDEPVPVREGLSGTIVQSRAPRIVDDLRTVHVSRAWLRHMRSYLGVPLVRRGDVIGVVHVTTSTERIFGDADVVLLRLAAARLSSALESSDLYAREAELRRDAERANRRLSMLSRISEALNESLDYGETIERVASVVVPEVADRCLLELVDDGGALEPVAKAAVDPSTSAAAVDLSDPRFHDTIAEVVRSGKAQLLESAMIIPLTCVGRILGGMVFTIEGSGRRFGPADLALAQEIAGRAATAIDHAKTYEERDRIASTLEASLSPAALDRIPAGVDVAAEYIAGGGSGEVLGDFFDVFQGRGNTWYGVIGDVAGKGVKAASTMALCRYTVRTAALSMRAPSEILRTLNRALIQGRTGRLATVMLVRLEPHDGGIRAIVSSGGHPRPLIVRADGVDEVVADGQLLGALPEVNLCDVVVELGPGELLVAYTDGLTEHRRGGDPFGETRVHRQLAGASGRPARTVAESLVQTLLDFASGPPSDDTAILVMTPAT